MVGSVVRVVFTSPEYLDVRGEPQHPKDLTERRLIQTVEIGAPGSNWAFLYQGKSIAVRADTPLKMNTNDAMIEAAFGRIRAAAPANLRASPRRANGVSEGETFANFLVARLRGENQCFRRA